jgi:spermidine/putrescine transport system permease protein
MLRGGLNPQTNAVGSLIFLCSILMLVAVELLLFRKRRT